MPSTVLQFPARRPRRAVATPLFPAELRPFPLTHYAGAVDRTARHLRSLYTRQQQVDAMASVLSDEWDRLYDLGAGVDWIERAILEFAAAIWAKLDDDLDRGGVA